MWPSPVAGKDVARNNNSQPLWKRNGWRIAILATVFLNRLEGSIFGGHQARKCGRLMHAAFRSDRRLHIGIWGRMTVYRPGVWAKAGGKVGRTVSEVERMDWVMSRTIL